MRYLRCVREVLFLALLSACAGPSTAGFAPGYPATEAAHREGMMSGEDARGRPDLLKEEATLSSQDEGSVCFDLVVRSAPSDDMALGERELACQSAAVTGEMAVNGERVSVYDYDEDGQIQNVVTERITADAYASFDHGATEGDVLRVVERSARLCCAVEASNDVTLRIGGGGRSLALRWGPD